MNAIIDKFTSDKNIALIGVSSDKQKFGNFLLREFAKKGYHVFPVHPSLDEVEGIRCYSGVKSLPDQVTNLIIVVNSIVTEQIVSQLKDTSIKRVWMHRGAGKGSASLAAIELCKSSGIEVVYGFCPMMFFAPSGIHSFHLWIRKRFGKVPAEYIK